MPFGQTVGGGGGGGGGGGQGCPAATWDPSGQVCIGGGVVAQAERNPVVATRSAIRLITISFSPFAGGQRNRCGNVPLRAAAANNAAEQCAGPRDDFGAPGTRRLSMLMRPRRPISAGEHLVDYRGTECQRDIQVMEESSLPSMQREPGSGVLISGTLPPGETHETAFRTCRAWDRRGARGRCPGRTSHVQ